MKTFLFVLMFIFCSQFSVHAAAPQFMQQQKQAQEEMIKKAIIEQQMAEQAAVQQAAAEKMIIQQNIPVTATIEVPAETQNEGEFVDMSDILKSLETSSKAWPLIVEKQVKGFILYKYIEYFKEQGITINKPISEYLPLIDSMIAQNEEMTKNPFENIVQLVATIEYDFDNGQDKDKMIIDLLGEDGYIKNKKRLGIP